MKYTMALVFALLVAFHTQADTLTAVTDPYPPFVDEDHPQEGIAMAIVRAAYATQGYEIRWLNMPWARAEQSVKNGTFDMLPITWYTKSRSRELLYSDPYVTNHVKFIQRRGEDFTYQGLESLRGKSVGTVRYYGYGDEFSTAEHFTREPVAEFIYNIRKLINGRIDLTLEDELVARTHIAKHAPELIDLIDFVEPPYTSKDLHVTSGYANPRHREIIDAFNAGLKEIKENGTFQQIMEDNNLL